MAPSPDHGLQSGTDAWAIVVGMFGLANFLNGVWMLASPAHWYANLPSNVPGTGPLNEHFVRDIGSIFFLLGLLLLISVWRRELRVSAMVAASAFGVMHALVHVLDSVRGLFPPGQWRFDAGPVYFATVLSVVLTAMLAAQRHGSRR
jgi:hypothetical protein